MRLTKLEMYGFKSFARKTEIVFDDGITAIIGPNGSGKSNIADAVRWVLGEQSAKALRGEKMEDVIFNGTEAKKPLSYGEVSLEKQNIDYITCGRLCKEIYKYIPGCDSFHNSCDICRNYPVKKHTDRIQCYFLNNGRE